MRPTVLIYHRVTTTCLGYSKKNWEVDDDGVETFVRNRLQTRPDSFFDDGTDSVGKM